ncbi:unnamed protein product [Urochloa humidicola]
MAARWRERTGSRAVPAAGAEVEIMIQITFVFAWAHGYRLQQQQPMLISTAAIKHSFIAALIWSIRSGEDRPTGVSFCGCTAEV